MTNVGRREFLSALGLAASALCAQETKPDCTLRIGPVTVEPGPGKTFRTTGYNGSSPGPLIRVGEGAAVTIDVTNESSLPELVHWHGLRAPSKWMGRWRKGRRC